MSFVQADGIDSEGQGPQPLNETRSFGLIPNSVTIKREDRESHDRRKGETKPEPEEIWPRTNQKETNLDKGLGKELEFGLIGKINLG